MRAGATTGAGRLNQDGGITEVAAAGEEELDVTVSLTRAIAPRVVYILY